MKHKLEFKSFLWGGYECTSARTERKFRLDMLSATKHDALVRDDYILLSELGIKTVREGFSWSRIANSHGLHDFSRYISILETGRELGIEQIWDLNHFDYPDWLDPFSDDFPTAFSAYALEVHKLLRSFIKGQLFLVPINEISFFAWIGADKGWWAPFKRGRNNGFRFKKQLVKASIRAIDAIRAIDSEVRFIQVDPFMRRLNATPKSKVSERHCREFNEIVRFEAWDMLMGLKHPECGGDPKYIDFIGVNYYHHNQEWVFNEKGKLRFQRIDWESPDRVPFGNMLQDVFNRYTKQIVITETGSFGDLRPLWWDRLFREVIDAKETLPILGVCVYPILDRPDSTNFLERQSGFWDFVQTDPDYTRHPHVETITIVKQFMTNFENVT